jgi:hypothetical protein
MNNLLFQGDRVGFVPMDAADPEVRRHVNLPAIVANQKFVPGEDDGEMIRLVFPDGFEYDAFPDEIVPLTA